MRRYLSRRLVYMVSLLISALFLVYALSVAGDVRKDVVKEYFAHKEFLFYLKNLPLRTKAPATEEALINLLSKHGLEPQKVFRTESGVEIQLKDIPWSVVPDLVKSLEDRFEIVSFSAVDNTGKGIFEVRIVVR